MHESTNPGLYYLFVFISLIDLHQVHQTTGGVVLCLLFFLKGAGAVALVLPKDVWAPYPDICLIFHFLFDPHRPLPFDLSDSLLCLDVQGAVPLLNDFLCQFFLLFVDQVVAVLLTNPVLSVLEATLDGFDDLFVGTVAVHEVKIDELLGVLEIVEHTPHYEGRSDLSV